MKKIFCKSLITVFVFLSSLSFIACHNKTKENTNTTTNANVDTSTTTTTAPVIISPDDSLRNGVRDATKDYPDVKATVDNGEITLTGTITRDKLPGLMQSLNSLHPKKINNQLTIKGK